ncbi:AAA family protein [Cyclospora cayetanensis]|uniref:AAA family protein n=1 Tax=Cyclospora cayetanensis TaxID=88456 RepID=A0A1D3CRF9_9EIME|nr:AAA family protein [Cyclospora cayetanensis]
MNARACLLSGPPGIGKTTAAAVAARRYGFQLLEFNASDSRNKAHIEELQDLVTGGVTVNFFKLDKNGKTTPTASGAAAAHGEGKFPCLLLDEVDGLSGGDRGGSQAMLKLIDTTRIPIICVCNDRMSTKVRTIASRCLDLRFEKPTLALLRARMQQIAAAEDLVVSDETLSRIAEISGGDMRQCVGQLQLLATQMRHRKLGGAALSAGKDAQVTLGPFECCKLLLDSRTGSKMKLWEKVDMFFVDYDMLPLLIQENYLTAIGQGLHQQLGNTSSLHSWDSHGTLGTAPSPELCALESSAKASRALCLADRANAVLRSNQEWSLLPTMAAFCCVDVPAEAVAPLACGGDPKATVERLSTYGLRREHLVDHMQSLMLRKQVLEGDEPAESSSISSSDTEESSAQPAKKRGPLASSRGGGKAGAGLSTEKRQSLAVRQSSGVVFLAFARELSDSARDTKGSAMLRNHSLRLVAGASVFCASAFMGFTYRVASAPPPAEEALPTVTLFLVPLAPCRDTVRCGALSEAERRRIFATKAGGWDREVFFQEILMGIGRWRKELIQQAKGDVLEVAAGTGRNFRYYDNARVRSLTVTDFCSPMVEEARTKKGELGTIPHSFRLANACKLPDPAEKYHAVVETFEDHHEGSLYAQGGRGCVAMHERLHGMILVSPSNSAGFLDSLLLRTPIPPSPRVFQEEKPESRLVESTLKMDSLLPRYHLLLLQSYPSGSLGALPWRLAPSGLSDFADVTSFSLCKVVPSLAYRRLSPVPHPPTPSFPVPSSFYFLSYIVVSVFCTVPAFASPCFLLCSP